MDAATVHAPNLAVVHIAQRPAGRRIHGEMERFPRSMTRPRVCQCASLSGAETGGKKNAGKPLIYRRYFRLSETYWKPTFSSNSCANARIIAKLFAARLVREVRAERVLVGSNCQSR